MTTQQRPYRTIVLLRGLIAFSLILFVLAKPIRSIILDLSEDKKEMSSFASTDQDSEDEDSESGDSKKDGSEESDDEEEKFKESIFSTTSETLLLAKRSDVFNIHLDQLYDVNVGVVFPPPEYH